jgi:hypothetical protein
MESWLAHEQRLWNSDGNEDSPVTLPDDQQGRLRCYKNALRNWNFRGYVRFKPRAEEDLANLLPSLSLLEIARELHLHVQQGGEIDEQKERRREYVSYEYHFDLRVEIGGRLVYFETVLSCEDPNDPDDPWIEVVSVH